MARARIPELEQKIETLEKQLASSVDDHRITTEDLRRAEEERARANKMVRRLADDIKAVHGGKETEA